MSGLAHVWSSPWSSAWFAAWFSGAAPAQAAIGPIRRAIAWVSGHTGIPALGVAALGLVLSFRLARRLARLALEVSLAAAILFALTRLGLLTW